MLFSRYLTRVSCTMPPNQATAKSVNYTRWLPRLFLGCPSPLQFFPRWQRRPLPLCPPVIPSLWHVGSYTFYEYLSKSHFEYVFIPSERESGRADTMYTSPSSATKLVSSHISLTRASGDPVTLGTRPLPQPQPHSPCSRPSGQCT